MNINQITPVILTFNERENIGRTLDRLHGFPRVVILDSGSTDDTRSIASAYPNVDWHERVFDNHAAQWNHALSLAETDWVLSLDADYVLTTELLAELAALSEDGASVYLIPFRFCVHGQPLRATLLPPRPSLFRRSKARYVQNGHTQVLDHVDIARHMRSHILHDDRKPLSRWLWAQTRYVTLEADKLMRADAPAQDLADRLRRWIVIMPVLTPVYILIGKALILDGWHGWHYAASRMLVELMYSLELIDRRISSRKRQS